MRSRRGRRGRTITGKPWLSRVQKPEGQKKRGDMKTLWRGAALAVTALLCVRPATAQLGIVSVTGGRVEGITAEGVTSFKGVPFAAPPVGNLRWRAPQPVRPWGGVRRAQRFAPSCMQDPMWVPIYGSPPAISEDCLYLNVWTPARSDRERLPVMVWIYGGGFDSGMTSAPAYEGTHLAAKGVVVVSVGYRVGAFGFLADSELSAESPHHVSGNYGLLDVMAALRWVKSNIGTFGGDPSRVTIFGESAGGFTVSLLTASPLATGLFQRAISESGGVSVRGGIIPETDLPAAQVSGERFLAKLGASHIATARALPAETLVKAEVRNGRPYGSFLPVADGYVFPRDAYDLYRSGRFTDTPLLLGTNSDEGRLLAPLGATPARFEAQIRAQFGSDADAILALYPHASDAEAEQAARDVVRDSLLAQPTWTWALLHAEKGADPVYLYYFDRHSPQAPLGPTHMAEIGYVFGNLVGSVRGAPDALSGTPGPTDVTLMEQIQSYWVNFAKTGDPNGPGLPHWPAFSARSQRAMYLDAHPHAGPVPNMKQIRALDAYSARVRREEAPKTATAP